MIEYGKLKWNEMLNATRKKERDPVRRRVDEALGASDVRLLAPEGGVEGPASGVAGKLRGRSERRKTGDTSKRSVVTGWCLAYHHR